MVRKRHVLGVNEGFCLLCLFMRTLWTLMFMCDVVVVVFVFVCLFTHLHCVCVYVCVRVCVCVCVVRCRGGESCDQES